MHLRQLRSPDLEMQQLWIPKPIWKYAARACLDRLTSLLARRLPFFVLFVKRALALHALLRWPKLGLKLLSLGWEAILKELNNAFEMD